ncbi:hypothetical protein D0N36_15515 [Hymenobacter lapidiphilus]|uniref:hypothetical protein n=1 Tax=Hymenobacter sp. CCM 8763 TaxID=2303334 RepID=UPI000E34212C|nr:hypothetical protein [Hymenobacter sp. CCM 8763]RFP64220.1 hypothetical protein D0N36_15515 [Hymenobacter sp. CCM 8763]
MTGKEDIVRGVGLWTLVERDTDSLVHWSVRPSKLNSSRIELVCSAALSEETKKQYLLALTVGNRPQSYEFVGGLRIIPA